MNNSQVLEFFDILNFCHKHYNDDYEQPSIFIPTLTCYQRKAVKWMIDKEKNNYFDNRDGFPFRGGILADETGLGKTIEMLCCIMENTAPLKFYNQKSVIKKCINTSLVKIQFTPSTSKYLAYTNDKDPNIKSIKTHSMLKSVASEMSMEPRESIESDSDEDTHVVACYCNQNPSKSVLVYCVRCGKGQHAQCVHFEPKLFQELPYMCSNCWIVNDRLQCKATLIVVPQIILNQWVNEIENNIAKSAVKVYVYNGLHIDGYVQPYFFCDYDIVITSSTTLSKELHYIVNNNKKNQTNARSRHSNKYNYPRSPLSYIKWWRICLDEGQALISGKPKLCDMISNLRSVHKWVITGTSVQKSLNDLYSILKFLQVSPYCHYEQFLQLMNSEVTVLNNCFSKLIWRSLKADFELNLPKLTHVQHWLTLPRTERSFYEQHNTKLVLNCRNYIQRLSLSLDSSIKNIDQAILSGIIGPLQNVCQACVHPQVEIGEFCELKEIKTLKKIMDEMIDKGRVECYNILHKLISENIFMAEVYINVKKPAKAKEFYRKAQQLMDEYTKKKFKIDKWQIREINKLNSKISGKKMKYENDIDVVWTLNDSKHKHLTRMMSEMLKTETVLLKKFKNLTFLENLKKEKENSTEIDTCKICSVNGDEEWSLLPCGHSVCSSCLEQLFLHSRKVCINCPMCRSKTSLYSIVLAKNQLSNIEIKGNFSIKIECVTLKLIELITHDPKVKVIIFSNWDEALGLLNKALKQNSINFRTLKTGKKYSNTLIDFQSNEKINALLMNLSLDLSGLYLTAATRIFFMEPIINQADKLKAKIGRIHSIGQTKPTFVHNFIIRNTIEENITNMLSSDMLAGWDDITLTQLLSLFGDMEEQ